MPRYLITGRRLSDGKKIKAEVNASSTESLRKKAEAAGVDMNTFSSELVDALAVNAPVKAKPTRRPEPRQDVAPPRERVIVREAAVLSPPPQPTWQQQPVAQPMAPPAAAAPPVVNNIIVQVGGNESDYTGGAVYGLASFLLPGLGQMLKGQVFNGLAWLFVVIIGYFLLIVPGLILHICCIVGAASSKKRRGAANVANIVPQ